MPRVTVVVGAHSISISSKDMKQDDSVDLTIGNWPEMAWHPAEVTKALAALSAQAHNPRRVNCQQGQNRSPTMAILYLWWKSGEDLGTVFDAVKEVYEEGDIELGTKKITGLLEQLLGGYCGKHRPTFDDVRAMVPGDLGKMILPK